MAFAPIAFTAPNYRDYKNNWVKAYEPGTTSPKSMALDADASVTVIKLQVDKDGFIVSAGEAKVIPYINGAYDLWMFPSEAEANNNDTSNAIRLADNITAGGGGGDGGSNFAEETITLSSGQTTVVFTGINAAGASIYIGSQDVDRGRLFKDIDYSVTDELTIELFESFPSGSFCVGISNEVAASDSLAFVKRYEDITSLEVSSSINIGDVINVKNLNDNDEDTGIWDAVDESTVTINGDNIRQGVNTALVRRTYLEEASSEMYRRSLVYNLPGADTTYYYLIDTYGYSDPYPTAMAVDESANELFVARATSGGTNDWDWVWVYHLDTGEFKTSFTFQDDIFEGLVIRYDGASRFIYAADRIGNMYKGDITTLPGNYGTVAKSTVLTGVGSQMTFNGEHFFCYSWRRYTRTNTQTSF